MKGDFRLYKNEHSNSKSLIFDLINGDTETKQTKGLAYIFSINLECLIKFLNNVTKHNLE